MKLLFMGTPDFAVAGLNLLAESNHEIIAIVTGADRRRGRGQKVTETPVAVAGAKLGIPVMKPQSIADRAFIQQVKSIGPDAIVLIAYGKIIPKDLLDLPPFGCINLHPSLLPKYRGASPLHGPLIAGDKDTGVTTMLMNESLDAGHILLQKTITIEEDENVGDLHDRLAYIGADLLVETINGLERGTIRPMPQQHKLATYAEKLRKTDIDWEKPADEIVRLVRGLTPFPGIYTHLNDLRINIRGARLLSPVTDHTEYGSNQPGAIVSINSNGLEVLTGKGSVLITHVQPEGKRPMSVDEFLNGYPIEKGWLMYRTD